MAPQRTFNGMSDGPVVRSYPLLVGKGDGRRGRSPRVVVSRAGSSLDPIGSEVSWRAWRLVAADHHQFFSDEGITGLRGWSDQLVETLHDPGRAVFLIQLSKLGAAPGSEIEASIGIGIIGAKGGTAGEASAVERLFANSALTRPEFPYQFEHADSRSLLASTKDLSYRALLQQAEVSLPSSLGDVEVPTNFNPVFNPLGTIASLMLSEPGAIVVRVTMLATEASPWELAKVDAAILHLEEAKLVSGASSNLHHRVDRGIATLLHLRETMRSQLFATELSCSAAQPLSNILLRGMGAAVTSAPDLARHQSRSYISTTGRILGGFAIERDPDGLGEALAMGLPLRGGVTTREVRDLMTLTEAPFVLPIPYPGAILPGINDTLVRIQPIPDELRQGTYIGDDPGGSAIHVPAGLTNQHALVLGESGSGKSRYLAQRAVDCARSGIPFLLLDPHGTLADYVLANTPRSIGITVIGGRSSVQLRLVPTLDADGGNLEEVNRSVGLLADATTASLHDEALTGPRWRSNTMVIGGIAAALGMNLTDAISIYADSSGRRDVLESNILPPAAQQTLALLQMSRSEEQASLVDWVISKFDPFCSGASGKLLAAAGEGFDLEDAVASGSSVIIDLSQLTPTELTLVGSIVLTLAFEGARKIRPDSAYHVIVDEAPTFHARRIETILAEARKFKLVLTLAAQSFDQFDRPSLRDAAASAGVKLAFRQAPTCAGTVSNLVDVTADELRGQPDLHAFLKVGQHEAVAVQLPPYSAS